MNNEDIINEIIGFVLIILLGIFVVIPALFCLSLLAILEIEYLFNLILGS